MNDRSPFRLWPTALALGLILALGATGGATAAAFITSAMIKDDTIKPRDLDFVIGVEAAHLEQSVALTKGWTTPLKTTMSVDDAGGLAVAQAELSLENNSEIPIDVTVQLAHQQDPDHVEVFRTTVPAFGSGTLPAGILCNGFPVGEQTVELRVSASAGGVTVTSGVLTMVAGPQL